MRAWFSYNIKRSKEIYHQLQKMHFSFSSPLPCLTHSNILSTSRNNVVIWIFRRRGTTSTAGWSAGSWGTSAPSSPALTGRPWGSGWWRCSRVKRMVTSHQGKMFSWRWSGRALAPPTQCSSCAQRWTEHEHNTFLSQFVKLIRENRWYFGPTILVMFLHKFQVWHKSVDWDKISRL